MASEMFVTALAQVARHCLASTAFCHDCLACSVACLDALTPSKVAASVCSWVDCTVLVNTSCLLCKSSSTHVIFFITSILTSSMTPLMTLPMSVNSFFNANSAMRASHVSKRDSRPRKRCTLTSDRKYSLG